VPFGRRLSTLPKKPATTKEDIFDYNIATNYSIRDNSFKG